MKISTTLAFALLLAHWAPLSADASTEAAPPKNRPTAKPTDTKGTASKPTTTLPPIRDFARYDATRLSLPAGIPEEFEVSVMLGGKLETLRLFRTSLRSANAKLILDLGGGKYQEAPLPPHHTYRGSVLSNGAGVAASLIDGKLWAMVDLPEATWYVQPMSDFASGRAANEHVVYSRKDVVPVGAASCGFDGANLALPDWMTDGPAGDPGEGSGSVGDGAIGAAGGEGGIAGTTPFIAEIAFDADYEFFQKNASNANATVNDIETVMNNVSFVYDRDVNISYEYTTFVVRTTTADPYTTTDMQALLCEFRTQWIATPENQIQRDVAQLYTGKTITGSVIGLAWLGTLCNQSGSACSGAGSLAFSAVESRFTTNLDFRTSLSAHELGHNWQAQHCDATAPCNIMCSIVNSCQGTTGANLRFNTTEVSQITTFRNAVSCDPALPAPITLPFSDGFDGNNGFVDATKWIYNKGGVTSTAASNEPSPTRSLNLDALGNLEYGDDEIRSNFMLLQGLGTVIVRYATQAVGVEAGEQLFVEYFNNQNDWILLNTITSTGVSETAFTTREHVLAADAKHNKFRLRFRTAVDAQDDDWYIDSVSVSQGTPPSNDECSTAILVSNGTVSIDSFLANGSTLDLPASCNEGAGVAMNADIWYLYIPTCTGTATVSTCGSVNFDSRIAAYVGGCPPSAPLIACSDNAASCAGNTSSMTFNVTQNLPVYIRVGAAGNGGSGTMTISCTVPPPPPCPADLNGDRVVDGADLASLLGGWGLAQNDLDGNGVVDGADLASLLGSWGNCP